MALAEGPKGLLAARPPVVPPPALLGRVGHEQRGVQGGWGLAEAAGGRRRANAAAHEGSTKLRRMELHKQLLVWRAMATSQRERERCGQRRGER